MKILSLLFTKAFVKMITTLYLAISEGGVKWRRIA